MLLPAREAADRLGVKIDTLYAYVSRGLLRSMEVAGSRERHYDVDEIEQFRAGRGTTRARPPAEDLIPVIGSSICLIENHRFYYRGKDALTLAETASLEDVAALLWEEPPRHAARTGRGRDPRAAPKGEGQVGLIERCQIRLAELASADHAALDLSHAGVARTGRAIVVELAACVSGGEPSSRAIHEQLAASWELT